MSKKKGNIYGKVVSYEPVFHKTSIGRKPSLCKMNKHKRRQFKVYKGQGKWDQTSILMGSLYPIKCHKILDNHKEVKGVVARADSIQDLIASVVRLEQEVLKIPMFVISGDQEE